jgi:hypothetical protein
LIIWVNYYYIAGDPQSRQIISENGISIFLTARFV